MRQVIQSTKPQDKGFKGALKGFVGAVTAGGAAPIDEVELIETRRATVMVMESLRGGERMDL